MPNTACWTAFTDDDAKSGRAIAALLTRRITKTASQIVSKTNTTTCAVCRLSS